MKTLEALCLSTLLAASGLLFEIMVGIETSRFHLLEKRAVLSSQPLDEVQKRETYKVLCERQKSCRTLAEAIYFEARSESWKGKEGVAHVIINRVNNPDRWPSTVPGVVYFRCQFSYTCDGSRKEGIQEKVQWDQSKVVAWRALKGLSKDPTGGADHYLNPAKVKYMPRWTKTMKKTLRIERHVYYKS
ncbi:hypothetical protein Epa17_00126 [Pseudomonas phage Epa17]|uniref:Cell wall hydrolase SleB domain-containing protein n=4 Tax=Nankokuvirus G1 TaxID=2560662 RepID=A0A6G9LF70_9CAUD|nr:hypothetical protein Epa24_00031 [Pseudomonas phage Epa24]QIQ64097.1 hypothetical protein Epa17_00126 [Pseudomonas phage Epa17]QIQ64988.1 cell wall hydrolase [Pseudomonas phage Epa16]QIQ65624.1 cell wall hydrolase [Pseudomonas phage Epa26]